MGTLYYVVTFCKPEIVSKFKSLKILLEAQTKRNAKWTQPIRMKRIFLSGLRECGQRCFEVDSF